MKILTTITEQDINPDALKLDTSNFSNRQAVRAVVLDQQNRVALLHVSNKNYHKLPGGGIDDEEDVQTALKRELLEEIGCKAKVVKEIGKVLEYRDEWQLFQESYCYLTKLVGEQKSSAFTEEEQDDGFEPMWARGIDEAIAILEADVPSNYDGKFIKRRDFIFLKAAKTIF